MRQPSTILTSSVLSLWLTAAPIDARAQTTPAAAPNAAATAAPVPVMAPAAAKPTEEPWKEVALSSNPLNLLIGHYGINAEWLPWRHHGLMISPYYAHVNATVSTTAYVDNAPVEVTYNNSFNGFGAELGYRFYTGDGGPTGFFVGPSLLFATYKTKGDVLGQSVEQKFNSWGYAVDLGGQAVVGGGFVIGGGFGMQHTSLSKDIGFTDMPIAASVLAGGGWRPRFLMSLGCAF